MKLLTIYEFATKWSMIYSLVVVWLPLFSLSLRSLNVYGKSRNALFRSGKGISYPFLRHDVLIEAFCALFLFMKYLLVLVFKEIAVHNIVVMFVENYIRIRWTSLVIIYVYILAWDHSFKGILWILAQNDLASHCPNMA